jgi:hypothetical protein
MKSIKESSKEWCSQNSNKKCKESCDGCWVTKTPLGCEQHNMELAYEAGANDVLEEINYILMDKDLDCEEICDSLFALIKQLKK